MYLGTPYNREFWWNTALRILNEHHRGDHDHKFVRWQKLPDGTSKGIYVVGGAGTTQVGLQQRRKYE